MNLLIIRKQGLMYLMVVELIELDRSKKRKEEPYSSSFLFFIRLKIKLPSLQPGNSSNYLPS